MSEPDRREIPDFRAGFVAVVGKPNVGKSTLVNVFVGEKVSIVSSKPQTTRRRIRGILTLESAQLIFVDTPGIHRPLHKLGKALVREATASIPDADVVLFVVDVSRPPDEEDRMIAQMLNASRVPKLLCMNKSDLLKPDLVVRNTDEFRALSAFDDWMLVSAIRGDNLDLLRGMVTAHLPASPRLYPPDVVTDQTEQAIAAELIREQALKYLDQEVPHALAVVLEDWAERRSELTYIEASLLVEKESQQGIVVGARGSMLKKIGQAARRSVESYLGRRIYLELHVRLRAKWRQSESELRRLGYQP